MRHSRRCAHRRERPLPPDAMATAAPPPAPPLPPHASDDTDRPAGAESPNQTDETHSGGGLPPAAPDGEAPDNRTGLRRPAGGTPNMPRP